MEIKARPPEPSMPKSPMRILNEFLELKDFVSESEKVRVFDYDRENVLKWTALLVPQSEPYNEKAYEIEIELPINYPRKPPILKFRTRIFHPNVCVKTGEVKLEQTTTENWTPAMRMGEVIEALVDLIENPNAENEELVANKTCAKLFIDNNAEYLRKAKEYAQKIGLQPPKPLAWKKQRPKQLKKTSKKVLFKDETNKNSGPYVAVERLLKLTYDENALKRRT